MFVKWVMMPEIRKNIDEIPLDYTPLDEDTLEKSKIRQAMREKEYYVLH